MRVSFDMNAFPTKPHPRWYCDNIWKPSKQLPLGSTIYLHSRNRGGENTSAVGSAKGGKFNTVSRLERSPYIYMITAWLAWSVEIRARECWHLAARWEKKRANRGGGGGSSGPSRARAPLWFNVYTATLGFFLPRQFLWVYCVGKLNY